MLVGFSLLALLLAAPPASAVSSAAPTSHTAESRRETVFRQTFRVRDGQSLSVDIGAGAVRVETTMSGEAEVVVEGDGRDVRAEFERLRFEARTSGNRLTVRTRPRSGTGNARAQFAYTIRIPRRFDVSVDTGSGSVAVGPLDGALSVDTGSGSVAIGRTRGRLSVDTGSGSVSVDELDGTGQIDTGSGSVSVALARIAPLSIDTGSGAVSVSVPRGSDATLALDGGTVRIDEALRFAGRRSPREAQGRIGRGGERIAVETGSGAITVAAR